MPHLVGAVCYMGQAVGWGHGALGAEDPLAGNSWRHWSFPNVPEGSPGFPQPLTPSLRKSKAWIRDSSEPREPY